MTERERDREKQRALDRAIDYEDRLVGRPARVDAQRRAPEGARSQERSLIVTNDQYLRLMAATEKMRAADAEVTAICAEIAAGATPPPNVVKLEAGGNGKGRRGGRRRAPAEGDAGTKPKKEYAKKVTCVDCGQVTGSQVVGGKRMPVSHQNPAMGSRCTGIFKEAELVEAGS